MATTHERYVAEITAKTSGAVGPLKAWDKQVEKSNKQFDKFAKNIGVSSQTLKTGLATLGGAALGAGLVTGLQKMVTGYAEAAKAAGDLAAATGSSVQEVSGMQAALQDAGVSAEQSAAMLTKFATAAGTQKGVDALKALNVELVKGPSGAADYAATMIKTVDAIEQIGDAAERNQKLVALFGKAGAKAFQDLQASGMSLSDAIAAIDTGRIFTPQDVRNAAAYDDAMDSLSASGQELGNTLGRTIVPALDDMLHIISPLVNAMSSLDGGTLLLAGSAVTLALNQGKVVGALSASAGALRTLGNAAIRPLIVDYSGLTLAAGESAAAIDATTAAATRGGTAGIVAGLAKGTVAVAVAWELVSRAVADAQDNLAQFGDTSDAVNSQMVADYSRSLSVFERMGLDIKDQFTSWQALTGPIGVIKTVWDEIFGGGNTSSRTSELEAYKKQQQDAARAAGAYAEASLDARNAQDDFNKMLAEGGHSAAELATALGDAGAAQEKKTRVDAAAKEALDAYAASSYGAVDATLAQIDADFALRDAEASLAEAVKRKGSNPDEVARSALRAADAQAKLAEQTAELAGQSYTAADAHDAMVKSLRDSLKNPDLTKAERKSIQDLIDKLKEAQATAKEGIVIGKVRFKEGTTKKQVDTLKNTIKDAFKGQMPWALGSQAQAQLDALKIPVEIAGVDAAKDDLAGVTKGKDGKDRKAKVHVDVVGDATAKKTLDDLAKPRTATITYSIVVPPTPGSSYPFSQPNSAALSSRQAMPTSLAVAGKTAGAAVTYAPQITNNYPKPERASDSIASSLRIARYLAGV